MSIIERNPTWIVCRECLNAWPPNDVALDNIHYDEDFRRCDGEIIALVPAADHTGAVRVLEELAYPGEFLQSRSSGSAKAREWLRANGHAPRQSVPDQPKEKPEPRRNGGRMNPTQRISQIPMPPDTHGLNAGRSMTMQERRRARRRWRRRTAAQRSARRLPLGVGAPSIIEAPEIRICEGSFGKKSVWIAGVGYLSTDERHELGRWLAGTRDWQR